MAPDRTSSPCLAGCKEQSRDEIVKDFLIESNQNLDRLDQGLVKLESEPSSKELLASIFLTIHTIQAAADFWVLPVWKKWRTREKVCSRCCAMENSA